MSKKSKYKWEDVGEREWFETTTEAMQYHWGEGSRYLQSAGGTVGSKESPWCGEVKVNGEWVFVGEFHAAREAKATVIQSYESQDAP